MKYRAEKQRLEKGGHGRPLTGVVALVTLCSGGAAVAAESADTGTGLEEIIVTTQKRAERLADVPVTVSAFTGASLEKMGVKDFLQVQQATPGLVLNTIGSVPFVFLRGVGDRVAGNGIDPSVATYVDDRYVSRPGGSLFDLLDLDRIEVLKGPQGTLYGRNATGGAIRFITNEVSDTFEGSVQGTAGNYRAWGLQGVVNIPITDTFGIRLAAMDQKRRGFATNLDPAGRYQWNDKNAQAVRLKLRWNISDRVVGRLSLNYWTKNDLSDDAEVVAPPFYQNAAIAAGGINGDRYHLASAIHDPNESNEASADLRFDVKLDGVDFQSLTSYSKTGADFRTDADATSAVLTDVIAGRDAPEDFAQEFRVLSNNDSNWQWLGGLFGFYQKNVEDSHIAIQSIIGSAGQQTIRADGGAVFGDVSYKFTNQWTLQVGARESYEKKKVDLVRSSAPVPFARVPYSDAASWSDFSPSATLEYRPGFGLLYAKYSQGFKSGGFNYPSGITNPVLKPEKLKSYEVGFKTDAWDRLRFDTSFFYYDFKDMQLQIASTDTAVVVVTTQNAASATIKGGEVDLTWAPIERLSVRPGISYTDGHYKDYPNASASLPKVGGPGFSATSFNASGYPLINTAKWTATVLLGYEFRALSERFPASLTYSWKDAYNQDFILDPATQGALRQRAYALLNGRIGYIPSRLPKLEVSLWGNNLTNTVYFNTAVINATGLYHGYAPPRTYGVDVKYSF